MAVSFGNSILTPRFKADNMKVGKVDSSIENVSTEMTKSIIVSNVGVPKVNV